MGSFYGNIVVRGPEADAVAKALEDLGCRAWIASEGRDTVVYDEKCDQQDLEALKRLAAALSGSLGCPALAFNNHDDSVLWFALAENGAVVDEYDSSPGYFDGGDAGPTGGDAKRLCAAFGVPKKARTVETTLRQTAEEVTFENERHQELLTSLGLPVNLGLLGYSYVTRGELAANAGGVVPRAVGGAEGGTGASGKTKAGGASAAKAPARGAPTSFRVTEVSEESAMAFTALRKGDFVVPPHLQPVFGPGPVPGYPALLRATAYLATHGTMDFARNTVTPGGLLADLFGHEPISIEALPVVALRAFGFPPAQLPDVSRAAPPAAHLKLSPEAVEQMRKLAWTQIVALAKKVAPAYVDGLCKMLEDPAHAAQIIQTLDRTPGVR